MLKRWFVSFIFLYSCHSTEPSSVPKNRFRPAYNYALMQNIRQGSDSDDGYYSTGERFKEAYIKTMAETNDMSGDYAYDAYVKQKYKRTNSAVNAVSTHKPISNAHEDDEAFFTTGSEFGFGGDAVSMQAPSA